MVVNLLKCLMKSCPVYPDPTCPILREWFNRREYKEASTDNKMQMRYKMSQGRYEQEKKFPFHNHLGLSHRVLREMLKGRTVLELGSFCGGTSAAYAENYEIGELWGVDIEEEFVETAAFYNSKNSNVSFRKALAEQLPFGNDYFDAIITYDVLEHVNDPDLALRECFRVLKHDGVLLAVFPSFYHPLGNHLHSVTSFPWLHLFFSDENIEKAYCQIMDERGEEAYWYKPGSDFEFRRARFHSVNGLSIRKFKRICHDIGFRRMHEGKNPLFKSSERLDRHPWLKVASLFFGVIVHIPGLDELFLQQASFIMRK